MPANTNTRDRKSAFNRPMSILFGSWDRHKLFFGVSISFAALFLSGCASSRTGIFNNGGSCRSGKCADLKSKLPADETIEQRVARIASDNPYQRTQVDDNLPTARNSGRTTGFFSEEKSGEKNEFASTTATLTHSDNSPSRVAILADRPISRNIYQSNQSSVRENKLTSEVTNNALYQPSATVQNSSQNSSGNLIVRGQSPDNQVVTANQTQDGSQNAPATYQYPELSSGATNDYFNSPQVGGPGNYNPVYPPPGIADLDVYLPETQTGRINFGGAYNSDNGLVGQFIIDERNFDIRRPPRSMQDIVDGTAWRGGGQAFRLELVPGSQLQRYLVSLSDPYFLNTDWSASGSAYYFDRIYQDWSERRLGGRIGLGKRIDQDISITTGLRMENVSLRNPRVNTSPILNAAIGKSNLFVGSLGIVRDTRDNQFLATTGDYMSATVSQAFGDHTFTRGDIDYRRYGLLYERPDGSGRHTVSFGTRLGVSSKDTPIFENYYAGGFSSMRGFDFRGVGPMDGEVRIGGPFEWVNSVEYMFPVTADDMIKGVVFCDFGTVDTSVKLNSDNFRVAPGFGLRVHLPAAGIGAPLAFDFGFPIATGTGDEERIFSFYIGAMR